MKVLYIILLIMGVSPALAQEWETDFEHAKKIALENNRPIVLVFQGSDWCAPCIKLDREVWSTDKFQKYAHDHFVMFRADFPRKKKNALPEAQAAANAKLAETYNKSGVFPFVVVMDAKGKVLGNTSYEKMGPEAYIKLLESFKG